MIDWSKYEPVTFKQRKRRRRKRKKYGKNGLQNRQRN